MNHSLFMGLFERSCDLPNDRRRSFDGERAGLQRSRKSLARNALHHQVVHFVLLANVVYGGDMGVAQLRQRQRLFAKSSARLISCHQTGREYLDGYDTFELLIARAIDRPHTTGANGLEDRIAPQLLSRDQNLSDKLRGICAGFKDRVAHETTHALVVDEQSLDVRAQLSRSATRTHEIVRTLL